MRGSAISGTSAGPMPVNRMARLKAVICLEPGTRSCGHCDRGNITFLFILNQDLADLPLIVRYRRPPCTVSARGKHFPTFPGPLPSSLGMGMQDLVPVRHFLKQHHIIIPAVEPGDPVQSTLKQRQSPAEYSMTVKCDTRRTSGTAAFTTHRYNVSLSCGPSIRLALHAALGRHQGPVRVYLIAARRAWINL
ncbi:hypothetical protein IG631_04385 [Alternaria alternata]|nr:hypothetical protein IG631_04385 [Alternaria alternata]